MILLMCSEVNIEIVLFSLNLEIDKKFSSVSMYLIKIFAFVLIELAEVLNLVSHSLLWAASVDCTLALKDMTHFLTNSVGSSLSCMFSFMSWCVFLLKPFFKFCILHR